MTGRAPHYSYWRLFENIIIFCQPNPEVVLDEFPLILAPVFKRAAVEQASKDVPSTLIYLHLERTP